MNVWRTRDKPNNGDAAWYGLWTVEPTFNEDGGRWDKRKLVDSPHAEWAPWANAECGLPDLAPGECREYELVEVKA